MKRKYELGRYNFREYGLHLSNKGTARKVRIRTLCVNSNGEEYSYESTNSEKSRGYVGDNDESPFPPPPGNTHIRLEKPPLEGRRTDRHPAARERAGHDYVTQNR